MDDRKAQLLDEISQLLTQYRREVPGQRRAWPESMKTRVSELHRTGMSFSDIARRTHLPYYTILKWRDDAETPSFRMVNVVDKKKGGTVTVARAVEKVGSVTETTPALAVVFPSGVRIEGLSVEALKELLPALASPR